MRKRIKQTVLGLVVAAAAFNFGLAASSHGQDNQQASVDKGPSYSTYQRDPGGGA